MSLDTYDNLKLEIIDWSHRDDIDLRIDTFIDLAEAEMFANSVEPLQVISQEVTATANMDDVTPSRFLAIPDGYLTMRKVSVLLDNAAPYELQYRAPSSMVVDSVVGAPCFFTITDQIEFDRNPDTDYTIELKYLADFTPLSSSNTTNAILTKNPNIYLFGALWALHQWTDETDKAQMYYAYFINAIKAANKRADMGKYGPAPVMIVEGSTP